MTEAVAQPVAPDRSTDIPLWWQVVAWLAMGVDTVWAARHGRYGLDATASCVVVAVVFALSAIGAWTAQERMPVDRRRWGIAVAIVCGLVTVILSPGGLGEVPLYLAASRITTAFDRRTAWMIVALATVATGLAIGYVSQSLAGCLAGIGIPFFAQRAADRRALEQERDRARALLLEVEAGRDAEAQAAALRERGRIAREMHDVLAHSLAGLSVQLQAARAVAQRDGATGLLPQLDRAADLAREGLTEARAAVGALGEPAAHGIEELPGLVRSHDGGSLDVAGTPQPLSPASGHAVYRAVQESLTNAARYAPGSPVRVALRWSAERLDVTIEDDGPAQGHTPLTGHGSGQGLVGMRERLVQVGGEVTAGPEGDGWRIALAVPVVAA